MNVVLASTFRDSVPYLDRYLEQCSALTEAANAGGIRVSFVWGENDSVDDTRDRLKQVSGDVAVVDCSTGAPYYRSTEIHAPRWANVAAYCNATLEAVPDCDALLWVESDLVWDASTLLALLGQVDLGVVAAPVYRGEMFYDTYTTRLDGRKFTPPRDAGLIRVDSCAGCIAIRGDLVPKARFAPDCCTSFTRDLGGVWLDTTLSVQQP